MSRSRIALLLLLAALGLGVAACGGDDDDAGAEATTEAAETTAETTGTTETGAGGESSTLRGSVGPGFDISLDGTEGLTAGSYTIVVDDTQYIITFLVMLCVGLVISTLTAHIHRQAEASRLRERRTEALYRLGRKLTGIIGRQFLAIETERVISDTFGGETAVFRAFYLLRGGKAKYFNSARWTKRREKG